MKRIRSADPWSAFLTSSRPDGRIRPPGAAEPGRTPDDEPEADARRRVLAQLRSAPGPVTLERLHHATRLGMLEVADAVAELRERGLVAVDGEIDEVVRLTEG